MKKRDPNLDLYRVLCAFGVVCIHVFAWTEHVSYGLWRLSCPSLIGFVIISSWFGIHFKPQKLLGLIATTATCVVICLSVKSFCGKNEWGAFFNMVCGYWYVWAYVFLMLFAPVVDWFVENCTDRRILILSLCTIGFMLWGWCFMVEIKVFSCIPFVRGFESSSGLVLLMIYTVTRILKRINFFDIFEANSIIRNTCFLVSVLMVFYGFRHNSSIFAYIYALGFLSIVLQIKIGKTQSRILGLISPSMFSVYLLHIPWVNYIGIWESMLHNIIPISHSISQILLSIIIFIATIILDIPRRLALIVITKSVHVKKGV